MALLLVRGVTYHGRHAVLELLRAQELAHGKAQIGVERAERLVHQPHPPAGAPSRAAERDALADPPPESWRGLCSSQRPEPEGLRPPSSTRRSRSGGAATPRALEREGDVLSRAVRCG